MWRVARLALLVLAACVGAAHAAETAPLTVEATISLGDVPGRIDHLAFDPARLRLYVAELGNNSVGVVDLKAGRVLQTLRGLDEPQGIGYDPVTDAIYVANGGDGSVRVFSGADYQLLGSIALGADADNVRVDAAAHRIFVGHGPGGIAVIDATTRRRMADIPVGGHPESFQLEPGGPRLFVNVPDAGRIAVVSREPQPLATGWPTGDVRANYPMTLDAASQRLIVVFRRPARLRAYDWNSGRVTADVAACADADDVFVDALRRRAYVICGEGRVETLDAAGQYAHLGSLPTAVGSRTGLFVPELDRLFVAIRASRNEPAAIWAIRPGQ
jgi:DNA-binding beta-propeller fold protein YncE